MERMCNSRNINNNNFWKKSNKEGFSIQYTKYNFLN